MLKASRAAAIAAQYGCLPEVASGSGVGYSDLGSDGTATTRMPAAAAACEARCSQPVITGGKQLYNKDLSLFSELRDKSIRRSEH